jgi:hypothetical protein
VTSSTTPISKVQIFDLSGRIILQEDTGNSKAKQFAVNINELQSGVYIVQTHYGNQVSSDKLVVGN